MFVRENEHRRLEGISEIERPECLEETLFWVPRGEHHPKEVSLRCMEAKSQVGLGRASRKSRGRARALAFNDHKRVLGCPGESKTLDHQRNCLLYTSDAADE